MGNFGMRLRAKQQLQTGARNSKLPGWRLQPPAFAPDARRSRQGCQPVAEGEKIEKVVRFGAFWCMTCGKALASTPHMVFDAPFGRMFYGRKMREVMRLMHSGPLTSFADARTLDQTLTSCAAHWGATSEETLKMLHFVAFCCIAVEMGNAAGVRNDFLRGQDQGTSTLPPLFPAWRHRHHTDGRRSLPGLRSAQPTALVLFPDRSRPARRTSERRWWRRRRIEACWWSYI